MPWALLLLLACAPDSRAAALKTGAAFLKIGTGARPEAMGGAYAALSEDVHALHYNPAGLAALKSREAGLMHTDYLLDTRFDFAGFAQPTPIGCFGVSVARLGLGNFEGRDENRAPAEGFGAVQSVYTIGFGTGVGTLDAGAALKVIDSRIGQDSASAVAADLGVRKSWRRFSLGAAILSVGRGLQYLSQRDPLPLALDLGASCRPFERTLLALDFRHEPLERRAEVRAGAEYRPFQAFSLRAGYASQTARDASWDSAALAGFSGGFGVRVGGFSGDYSFTPFGELGKVQRVSVGAAF
jgi:hypothetical protein